MRNGRSIRKVDSNHFVGVDEVLRELQIHRSTLYRLQKSGALVPLKRPGDRRVYYDRRQVTVLKQLHPKHDRLP